jgi:hypothetical protein
MPVSIYRLSPGLLSMVVRRSRHGAVCYTCGKPLKLRDIIVSNIARASHRNFRHAECAVQTGMIDEAELKKRLIESD